MKFLLISLFSVTSFMANAQYDIVYNKKNLIENIDTSASSFLILLKNNRNCYNCFGELVPLFDSLKNTNSVDSFVAIILTDSEEYNTYAVTVVNKYLDKILFDYTVEKTDFISQKPKHKSLFTQYNVYTTPALLLIKNKKVLYIPTEELFSAKPLSLETLAKIYAFYKN
ncbi:MAG: hypothetical protein SGJ10_04500 [Bacteroidota bacterium]|nr:hypothetical protein [Bacteroidota bacterium]